MQALGHTLKLCAVGALLLPILAGCGGGGGGGNGNNGGSGNNGGQPVLSLSFPTATRGLVATLSEDRSTVAVNGTVTYTVTLTNPATGTAQTINAPSAATPPAQLIVTDASGNRVYDPIPPAPLTTVSLAPGQSLTQSVSVQVFGTAGTYTAAATFSFPADSPPPPVTTVGPLTVTAQ